MGVLDTMEGTTLATRAVELCLDADVKGRWDLAALGLEEAARLDQERGSMAMEHTVAKIEEMDALRDRMAASTVMFEFRALDWQKRLTLQAEHPPREDNILDQARGYNMATFCPELIKKTCIAATGADGERVTRIPAKSWTKMFSRLNLGQFQQLFNAAAATSDVAPAVPTSARFLLMNQDSEASSTQPGPGMSRPRGSAAGSRRTSRRTRTTKQAASSK